MPGRNGGLVAKIAWPNFRRSELHGHCGADKGHPSQRVTTPPWCEQGPCLPIDGDCHPSAQTR
jgi:hypothetical protein